MYKFVLLAIAALSSTGQGRRVLQSSSTDATILQSSGLLDEVVPVANPSAAAFSSPSLGMKQRSTIREGTSAGSHLAASMHGGNRRFDQPSMVEVRRYADDGIAYTQKVFQDYYGADAWQEKWDAASPAPDLKAFDEFQVGDEVDAKVMRLAAFGAFCDIGAPVDGLLHISQISPEFISDINDKLTIDQVVKAKIQSLDKEQGRIGLTCRTDGGGAGSSRTRVRENAKPLSEFKVGDDVEGKVTVVQSYGAFVDFGSQKDGLVHISELADEFVDDINARVSVGDDIKCSIKSIDPSTQRVSLSCKSQGGVSAKGSGSSGDSYDYYG